MTNVRLIAELGSCHMGKLDYIKEAIDRCQANRIDALKLQLFPNDKTYTASGNVWLPPEMFSEAFEYAKDLEFTLTASAFDSESLDFLLKHDPEFVKLAYSKKEQEGWIETIIESNIEAIVSCDVMTDHLVPKDVTKLYCIPEYPVRYEVAFDGLFGSTYETSTLLTKEMFKPGALIPKGNILTIPGRFDGFSDHTLGIRQTKRAIKAGAKIIEKHVKLGKADESCPDSRFAVSIEEFASVR